MKVTPTKIPDVLLIEPRVFKDERGFFMETFNAVRYRQAGVTSSLVQDNWSRSVKHTLRGLHFQSPHFQGKLVQVMRGSVFDVAVDIRRKSKTFGQWVGEELSEENGRQMWIPAGFAHGFCVLSDVADFVYKCSEVYDAGGDAGIAWNDPTLGITWPTTTPLLSPKDAKLPRLADCTKLL